MNAQLRVVGAGVIASVFLSAQVADASIEATYGFKAITSNGVSSVATAEAQFFVDLVDTGNAGEVRFNFRNVGLENSVIAQIYFEDFSNPLANPSPVYKIFDAFLGLVDADDGVGGDLGVDFSQDAPNNPNGNNTPNLPSANSATPDFEASLYFAADADPPVGLGGNSIDPGESLGILFSLVNGLTVADVKSALDLAISDPTAIGTDALTLRIGIHGQAFANGQSESLINTIPPPLDPNPQDIVPEATSALIWLGLACVYSGRSPRRRLARV